MGAYLLGFAPRINKKHCVFAVWSGDSLHNPFGLLPRFRDCEMKMLIVSAYAGEIHVGGIANIVCLKPPNNIFIKDALDNRLC